jgi:hypothetical protein
MTVSQTILCHMFHSMFHVSAWKSIKLGIALFCLRHHVSTNGRDDVALMLGLQVIIPTAAVPTTLSPNAMVNLAATIVLP